VAETVYNARRQQEITGRSHIRYFSPAGYQRRHGAKDHAETGEALRRPSKKPRRGVPAYNLEREVAGMASG
jgi:hypothetical protein